jgi:hypothetical protein
MLKLFRDETALIVVKVRLRNEERREGILAALAEHPDPATQEDELTGAQEGE